MLDCRQKKAVESTWLDSTALTPPQETMLTTRVKAGVRDARVQIIADEENKT